jgi:NADH:ubiquinone oxidoreductase subunit C
MIDEHQIEATLRLVCEDETITLERGLGEEFFADIPVCRLAAVVTSLQEACSLHHLSAISGLADGSVLRVFYHLWLNGGLTLRVACSAQERVLPTISTLFPVANWYEREVHDLFGIAFVGHPDLRSLLLPEGWTDAPPMRNEKQP